GPADVRAARPRDHRGYHVQVASSGRRRPQGRPHVFAARSDHRGDGASPWIDGRHPRYERFSEGAYAPVQSVGRSASVPDTMTRGAVLNAMTDISPPSAAASTGDPSPMMAQYLEIKRAHPSDLLFYRMGDFYEMFFDDAVVGAKALDL